MSRFRQSRLLLALLLVAMGANVWLAHTRPENRLLFDRLPPAPRIPVAPLFGLGDGEAGGRLITLWLQGFDTQAAADLRLLDLDYGRLQQWLWQAEVSMAHSVYPIFLAAMIYGSVPDPARAQQMYRLVRTLFRIDPQRRWYWLAMATSLAWHRLEEKKLPLAMAEDLYRMAPADAPDWARFLKLYLLRSANEVEMALFMARRALEEGRITSERDARTLAEFIQRLEQQAEERAP